MDRAAQDLFHSLIRSGALGEGSALTPPVAETKGEAGAELVFRTTAKDWILIAAPAASREMFLQLAQAAMAHAIDMSEVPAETGIVFAEISPELKSTSDRLHIASFKVKPSDDAGLCGFCGSSMAVPAALDGWKGCARCQRLLRSDTEIRICPTCLGAFSSSPEMEEKIRGLVGTDEVPLPDLAQCSVCRSPDHRGKLTAIDVLHRAVGEGRLTLDQVKGLKMPGEYMQLISLRVQLRRS